MLLLIIIFFSVTS